MKDEQPLIADEKPEPTARQLSEFSKQLYDSGPLLMRELQHWRPYICPFEELIKHLPEGAAVLDAGCSGGLFLALPRAGSVSQVMVLTFRRPLSTWPTQ